MKKTSAVKTSMYHLPMRERFNRNRLCDNLMAEIGIEETYRRGKGKNRSEGRDPEVPGPSSRGCLTYVSTCITFHPQYYSEDSIWFDASVLCIECIRHERSPIKVLTLASFLFG